MWKAIFTIALLFVANIFMILAWYGHIKFGIPKPFSSWGIIGVIVSSWLIAFIEYCFQVPANRMGAIDNGGPFTLMQLKVIQEALTLIVFVLFSALFVKEEKLTLNNLWAFLCLIGAVFFTFRKYY